MATKVDSVLAIIDPEWRKRNVLPPLYWVWYDTGQGWIKLLTERIPYELAPINPTRT